MLDRLPIELTIKCLSYLPIQTLQPLRQLSYCWRDTLDENSQAVFHNACIHHGFILICRLDASLDQVISERNELYGRSSDIDTWAKLFKFRYHIEKSWLGKQSSRIKRFSANGNQVHRIKVDEKRGLLITTKTLQLGDDEEDTDGGELIVSDLHTGEKLWNPPSGYVRVFAHIEYGEGFLIFDRLDASKEVWRIASEFPNVNFDERPFRPDEIQQLIWEHTLRTNDVNRGTFRPWALLRMPSITSAYRFVYPSLLTASYGEAFILDIPSSTLVRTITDTDRHTHEPSRVMYVELNDTYAFICRERVILLFSRENGSLAYALAHSELMSFGWNLVTAGNIDNGLLDGSGRTDNELVPQKLSVVQGSGSRWGRFFGAHISADGKILACTHSSGLAIVKIAELVNGSCSLVDAVLRLALPSRPNYLAFEHGRVAITCPEGLFIITLQPELYLLQSAKSIAGTALPDHLFPNVSISKSRRFGDMEALDEVSCLQMTESRVFFTCKSRDGNELDGAGPASLTSLSEDLSDDAGGDDDVHRENEEEERPRYSISVWSIDTVPGNSSDLF